MKINENDAILTPRVLLVPYSTHHVPTYHEWMEDEELRSLTASERLTLSEEYAMQASWRQDPDKLTFIVCASPFEEDPTPGELDGLALMPGKEDAPEKMIGDVNLFLFDDDGNEDEENKDQNAKGKEPVKWVVGELEIMIARKSARGQGMARAALLQFLWYIITELPAILSEDDNGNGEAKTRTDLKYLRVKIDKDNVRSIKLFERVGFTMTSPEPNYFGEVELRVEGDAWVQVENMLPGEGLSKRVWYSA